MCAPPASISQGGFHILLILVNEAFSLTTLLSVGLGFLFVWLFVCFLLVIISGTFRFRPFPHTILHFLEERHVHTRQLIPLSSPGGTLLLVHSYWTWPAAPQLVNEAYRTSVFSGRPSQQPRMLRDTRQHISTTRGGISDSRHPWEMWQWLGHKEDTYLQ